MSENLTFPVQIDTVCFSKKPAREEIGSLKPRLAAQPETVCTPESFTEAVLQGRAYNPGILHGGARAENWTKQQLFCLDIDNKDAENFPEKLLTPEQALQRCRENDLVPFLIYSTFSSTPQLPKFRICLRCETCITDTVQREHVQRGLMALFPESDQACKNADRLYFGGREQLHFDAAAVFSPDTAENLCSVANSLNAECQRIKNRSRQLVSGSVYEQARAFDLLRYVQEHFQITKEKRFGRYVMVDPCPVCKHDGDFCIYPAENTFCCFGGSAPRTASGKQPGGSIVELLELTRHCTKKEALRAFQVEELKRNPDEEQAAFQKGRLLEHYQEHTGQTEKELPPFIYAKCDRNGVFLRYEISCPKLADDFRSKHAYFWLGTPSSVKPVRYLWENGVYRQTSDEAIKHLLRQEIENFDPELVKTKVLDETAKLLFLDPATFLPAQLNTAEHLVNFKNGFLDLNTMQLIEHSTGILSTVQLPLQWKDDPDAEQHAPTFCRYLDTLTDGDESKKHFLLQWVGCILSNIRGDVLKKTVFLYGKGDTGKSQLPRLCARLLGSENVCSTTLHDLEGNRFAMFGIYGKRLAYDPDMSFARVAELSKLKAITGGDKLSFEQKNRDPFTDAYKGLTMFVMNDLPKFGGDHGDHVYQRIVPIRCDHVIPEQEKDAMLVEKMFAERQAILCLCMRAAREVLQNGHKFDLPAGTAAELEEYKAENSCAVRFFRECCKMRESCQDGIGTNELRRAFENWTLEEGDGYKLSPQQFRQEVADYLGISTKNVRQKYHGKWFYPLTLSEPASRAFAAFSTPFV